jgi:hypothetical protein
MKFSSILMFLIVYSTSVMGQDTTGNMQYYSDFRKGTELRLKYYQDTLHSNTLVNLSTAELYKLLGKPDPALKRNDNNDSIPIVWSYYIGMYSEKLSRSEWMNHNYSLVIWIKNNKVVRTLYIDKTSIM